MLNRVLTFFKLLLVAQFFLIASQATADGDGKKAERDIVEAAPTR